MLLSLKSFEYGIVSVALLFYGGFIILPKSLLNLWCIFKVLVCSRMKENANFLAL